MTDFIFTLIYGALIGRCVTLWLIERKPRSDEEIMGVWLAHRCVSAVDKLKFAPDCVVSNRNTLNLSGGRTVTVIVEARK